MKRHVADPSGLVNIYALCHPETGEIRYIGQTRMKLKNRLGNHMHAAICQGRKSPVNDWIRKYGEPKIVLITRCGIHEADEVERLMIRTGRECSRLLNVTPGGRVGARGHRHSEETKERMRQVKLGRTMSPEARAKMSAAKKGKKRGPRDAATRAKISATLAGRKRESMRGRWLPREEA